MTTLVLCELAPSNSAALPEGALPWLLRGEAELLFLGTEPGVVASRGCAAATRHRCSYRGQAAICAGQTALGPRQR